MHNRVRRYFTDSLYVITAGTLMFGCLSQGASARRAYSSVPDAPTPAPRAPGPRALKQVAAPKTTGGAAPPLRSTALGPNSFTPTSKPAGFYPRKEMEPPTSLDEVKKDPPINVSTDSSFDKYFEQTPAGRAGEKPKGKKHQAATEEKPENKHESAAVAKTEFLKALSEGTRSLSIGSHEHAIERFNAAIAVNANVPEVYRLRGLAFLQNKQYADAIKDLTLYLQHQPDNRRALLDRAAAEYRTGDTRAALNDYHALLKKDGSNYGAVVGAAMAKYRLGDKDQAVSDLLQLTPAHQNNVQLFLAIYDMQIGKGDYTQARNACTAALKRNPNNAELLNARGRANYYLKQFDQAEKDLIAADDAESLRTDLQNDLGYCLYERGDYGRAIETVGGGGLTLTVNEINEANLKAACEKSIQINLEKLSKTRQLTPEICRALAAGYMNLPDLPMAAKYAQEVVRIDPNDPASYMMLGKYYFKKSDYKKAVEYFTKQIQLDKTPDQGYLWRGISMGADGNFQGALADFNVWLQKHPNSSTAHMNRGVLYKFMKQYDKAEFDIRNSLKINPDQPTALANLGSVLALLNRNDEAEQSYNRSIELGPNETKNLLQRGVFYFNQDKLDLAIKDFQAMTLLQNSYVAKLYLGRCAFRKKDYEGAIKFYLEARTIQPTSAEIYDYLGFAEEKLKRYDKALAYYDEMIRLAPKNADNYASKASVYRSMNRLDEALATYEKARTLDPKADIFLYRIADIYFRSNRSKLASADLEKYLKAKPNDTDALWLGEYVAAANKDWKGAIAYSERYLANRKSLDSGLDYFGVGFVPWYCYRQLGDTKKAEDALILAGEKCKLKEWPHPVLEFLLLPNGESAAAKLLTQAKDQGQQTEAHLWIGVNEMLKGNKVAAKEHFEWVVSKGTPSYFEVVQARDFLKDF